MEPTTAVLTPVNARATEGERLARAVASAMADPTLAAFVRDEMRASPYTRHRVAFQTLLASQRMPGFAESVARHLGLTAAALRAKLEPLPTMEFYVESKAQRLSWRGTPDVVVAAQLPDERRPALAFRGNGTSVPLERIEDATMRGADAPPVFYLLVSDGLAIRIDPQTSVPGMTIQDPGDGEIGGLFITEVPGKEPRVTQLSDFVAGTQLRTCNGCIASVASPDTTFLWGIHMVRGQDYLSDTDPLELRWYAEVNRNSDGAGIRGQWTNLDIGNYDAYYARLPLIDAKIGAGYYIWLKLVENDGWMWSDDDWGWWDINSSAQNYWSKVWSEPYWAGGANRCGDNNQTGYYTCPYITSWGGHFWREANFNVAWNPAGLPVAPYQGVVGPTSLHPYVTYQWSAENLEKGTGPYSYQWYVDNQPTQTSAVLETSFGPSSQHSIQVEVTDPTGYYSISDPTFTVTVNTGTCQPNEINCYETLRAPSADRSARRARPQPRIRQH